MQRLSQGAWRRKLQPEFKSREDIYSDLYGSRQFDAVYILMLVLSCLIALLGLLVNSPAVIIGAMLISPLMGPILSCGLALTLAEWDLGTKAVRNVALSVLESVLVATVATFFSPLQQATPEILARSNPNLMDLFIAFFSGVAGVLALTSRKSGMTIIPGVAIATAVMPPLATTGYGLATAQWNIAGGGFMLFFTNLTAIIISADLVFLYVGFRPRHQMLERKHNLLVRYRILAATLILAVVSIPLVRTLLSAVRQARVRQAITTTLKGRFEQAGRARIDSVDFRMADSSVFIDAVVRTTHYIEPAEVREIESVLSLNLNRKVQLKLEQVRLEQGEEAEVRRIRDFLASGVIRPLIQPEPSKTPSKALWEIQNKVQTAITRLVQPLNIASATVSFIGRQADDLIVVELEGTQPAPSDPGAWAVITAALAEEAGARVRLRGNIRIAVEPAEQPPDRLHFAARSSLPNRADLARAREWMQPWKDRPDVQLSYSASAAADAALTARRITNLRRRFPRRQATPLALVPEGDPNTVRLALTQVVDAQGQPAASAAAAAPLPAPQPAATKPAEPAASAQP
ncbi:MAG: TIGR00341 family protein, partial [Terriglobales bacterium]